MIIVYPKNYFIPFVKEKEHLFRNEIEKNTVPDYYEEIDNEYVEGEIKK
ncbi:MAG: hypothetical protein ACERKV_04420 [Clostridiaceae bacterium]